MPKKTIPDDQIAVDDQDTDNEQISVGEQIAQPAPKPGSPDYDWSADYGTDDLFMFTFPGGTVVALKSFASIYSKTWLYKIRELQTDIDVEFASIDRASSDTARAVIRSLDDTDGDPLDALFKAWVAAGTSRGDGDEGLTPGE